MVGDRDSHDEWRDMNVGGEDDIDTALDARSQIWHIDRVTLNCCLAADYEVLSVVPFYYPVWV